MQMDQTQNAAILSEIKRLLQNNPNTLPVYIIINEPDESKLPDEMPIMLFSRELKIADLVDKMKKKFKDYEYVYLFGKDREKGMKEDLSLREKRKRKGMKKEEEYEGQKVVFLDEQQLQYTVGYAHERYCNDDGLLVVVVCSKPLPRGKIEPPKLKETVLIFCGLLCVLVYLFLAYNSDTSSQAAVSPVAEAPPL